VRRFFYPATLRPLSAPFGSLSSCGGNKKAGKYLDIWEKGCNFAPTFRKMCDCEQEVELKFKNKKA